MENRFLCHTKSILTCQNLILQIFFARLEKFIFQSIKIFQKTFKVIKIYYLVVIKNKFRSKIGFIIFLSFFLSLFFYFVCLSLIFFFIFFYSFRKKLHLWRWKWSKTIIKCKLKIISMFLLSLPMPNFWSKFETFYGTTELQWYRILFLRNFLGIHKKSSGS